MIKPWFPLLVFCLLYSVSASARDIVVRGFGETQVVPDTLSFSIYVKEKGPLVSKLYGTVNQKVGQILTILEKEQVAAENVQSMGLQVHPWYDYENRNRLQKGFELSRTIDVVLTDTSRLSYVLDYIFRIGNLEVGNFALGTSDNADFYEVALQKAMVDAKHKAKLLASNGGVSLGNITAIRESSTSIDRPMTEMRLADSGGAGQFVPGNISISANVEVVFSIKP